MFWFQTRADATSVRPGSTLSVPFTVSSAADGVVNASATGTYSVRVSNDQGYTSSAPATVTLGDGGVANGTAELTVPGAAASGSAVTLTVEASKDGDVNYAVLRLAVVAEVTPPPSAVRLSRANSRSEAWFILKPGLY